MQLLRSVFILSVLFLLLIVNAKNTTNTTINYSSLPAEVKSKVLFEHLSMKQNYEIRALNHESLQLADNTDPSKLNPMHICIKLANYLRNLTLPNESWEISIYNFIQKINRTTLFTPLLKSK